MRIHTKIKYYKHSRIGEMPISYHAEQPRGVNTNVYATIKLDPILKSHQDLQETLLAHELTEIEAWGKGIKRAHTIARQQEQILTKNIGGVSGFWHEIYKREHRR